MSESPDWHGQNRPRVYESYALLPVMSVFLEYDEDSIYEVLAAPLEMGWDDDFANQYAWSQRAYRVSQIVPDFGRYGGLPYWFTREDGDGHLLTPQGQVDRFLLLLDRVYGGLPDDHTQANPRYLADALLELYDNLGEYLYDEPEYEQVQGGRDE